MSFCPQFSSEKGMWTYIAPERAGRPRPCYTDANQWWASSAESGVGSWGADGCLPTFFTTTLIMYGSCAWGTPYPIFHNSSLSLKTMRPGQLVVQTRRQPPLPKLVGKDESDLKGSLKCAELNEDCEFWLLKNQHFSQGTFRILDKDSDRLSGVAHQHLVSKSVPACMASTEKRAWPKNYILVRQKIKKQLQIFILLPQRILITVF